MSAASLPATTGRWRARRMVLGPVAAALVVSRGLVWAAAVASHRWIAEASGGGVPDGKVVPGTSHPFGGWPLAGAWDALWTPLVRWDALWYLSIARSGYDPPGLVAGNPGSRSAFFPLYPLAVAVPGQLLGDAAALLAATALSIGAFGVGLAVVHRLGVLELGAPAAGAAVWLLALWPASYFASAPYTEGLFLALSAGAFWAARTERWALAGVLGALAAATRNTGVLLLVPLGLLLLYGPRGAAGDRRDPAPSTLRARLRPVQRPDRRALWLALVPLGLVAFSAYLQHSTGDAQGWRHAQEGFGRMGLTSPLTTARGVAAGLRDGLRDPSVTGLGPTLWDAAALCVVAAGVLLALRRLPIAYAAWAAVAVVPALLTPFGGEPLRSLPRFALVLFPLALGLGAWLAPRPRLLRSVLAGEGLVLVVLTAAFAAWSPFV